MLTFNFNWNSSQTLEGSFSSGMTMSHIMINNRGISSGLKQYWHVPKQTFFFTYDKVTYIAEQYPLQSVCIND